MEKPAIAPLVLPEVCRQIHEPQNSGTDRKASQVLACAGVLLVSQFILQAVSARLYPLGDRESFTRYLIASRRAFQQRLL